MSEKTEEKIKELENNNNEITKSLEFMPIPVRLQAISFLSENISEIKILRRKIKNV